MFDATANKDALKLASSPHLPAVPPQRHRQLEATTETCVQRRSFLRRRSRAQNLSQADGGGGCGGASAATEAIVPGLDFCNHSAGPNCRWELRGDQVIAS